MAVICLSRKKSAQLSSDKAISKLQATFRGKRAKKLHLERVQQNKAWSPYVAASTTAVSAMLSLAETNKDDILVDIGSGDGRILIQAIEDFNISKAIGVEIDPVLVAQSRNKVKEKRLTNKISIFHDDWANVNLTEVSIVTLFFLPHETIAPMLIEKLQSGTRVITYVYPIKEWKAKRTVTTVPFLTKKGTSTAYLYVIP